MVQPPNALIWQQVLHFLRADLRCEPKDMTMMKWNIRHVQESFRAIAPEAALSPPP